MTHLHSESRSHDVFLPSRFCSGSSAWVLVISHLKSRIHRSQRIPKSARTTPPMDRVRWSGKAIPFRSLVDDPAIQKPALGKTQPFASLSRLSHEHRYTSSSNRHESHRGRRENRWRIHHGIALQSLRRPFRRHGR